MGLRRKNPPGTEAPSRAPGDPLPADLLQWLETRFASLQRDAARIWLVAAVTADAKAAEPRLLPCAALAARGTLARLQALVARLRHDWREVVAEGEFAVRK